MAAGSLIPKAKRNDYNLLLLSADVLFIAVYVVTGRDLLAC